MADRWCHRQECGAAVWGAGSSSSGTANLGVDTRSCGGICQQLTVSNKYMIFGFKGFDLGAALMQLLVTGMTLAYIARNHRAARHEGSREYASRLVLPAYVKLLCAYGAVTAFASAAHLIESAVKPLADEQDVGLSNWICRTLDLEDRAIVKGLDWGLFHMALEGLTFFMMQKGAGSRAFKRALTRSLCVGIGIFCVVAFAERISIPDEDTGQTVHTVLMLGLQLANLMAAATQTATPCA
eukprot:COSAG01_NODE_3285_length_6309_cov_2.105153_10_plen_240_part_00